MQRKRPFVKWRRRWSTTWKSYRIVSLIIFTLHSLHCKCSEANSAKHLTLLKNRCSFQLNEKSHITTGIVVFELDWPAFKWQLFWENKISAGCLLKTNYLIKRSSKTKHCNLTRKFVCLLKCKFLSVTLFLGGNQLNFSSQKKLSNECMSVIRSTWPIQLR